MALKKLVWLKFNEVYLGTDYADDHAPVKAEVPGAILQVSEEKAKQLEQDFKGLTTRVDKGPGPGPDKNAVKFAGSEGDEKDNKS